MRNMLYKKNKKVQTLLTWPEEIYSENIKAFQAHHCFFVHGIHLQMIRMSYY